MVTECAFFEKLNSEQKKIAKEYLEDNGKKIYQICRQLIYRKNVPQYQEDDLYSLGYWTFLETIQSYKCANDCNFKTYFANCIWKAFYDWTRDSIRGVRCNLLRDKNGKIILRDKNGNIVKENGNVTIIPNISLDAKIEEDVDWCEKIASDFNIEKEVDLSSDNDEWHEEVRKYLNGLSPLQKQIAILLSEGEKREDICIILHIDNKQFDRQMKAMRSFEKVCCLY